MENKLITGQCPHCKTQLSIMEGESIACPSCDVIVTAQEIAKKDGREYGNIFGGGNDVSVNASQYAILIENPSSGLAYLENRFETYDWEDYENNIVFEMEDVETVVEKNKVTNANNPETWLLEFKSVVVPYTHKIQGALKIAEEIVKDYNPLDLTNTFELFDSYLRIACALQSRKESVYKILDSDIKFMEKFKISSEALSDAQKEYAELKENFDKVIVVKKVEELPGVGQAIEKIQQGIAEELAKEGINAESVYKEAVEEFSDPIKSENALAKFQSLKGYKDSSNYIKRINTLTDFNGVIETNGKLFYAITSKEVKTFDVKAPTEPPKKSGSGCGKKAKTNESVNEPSYDGEMTSLYKIVKNDYDPDNPVVDKISNVISSYNSKLFYVSDGKEIDVINLNNNKMDKLDKGNLGDYDDDIIYGLDKQSVYLKKRLDAKPKAMSRKGCSRKAKEEKIQYNNFSLIKIDLASASVTTAVDELIDVMDVFGDYVFFTQSRDVIATVKDKKGKYVKVKEPKSFFSSYNLKTGEIVDMLDENVCIVGASEGKVAYSKFSPVTYNMNLYVYDVQSKESVLLERNIYDAIKIHDGKVLYTVGSLKRRSLFSIKLDGTERTEILLNVEEIKWFDKNWMYVVKGYSYNTTLIKISYDGKKRVVVASGIRNLIQMTAGCVYFIDFDGNLCIVRTDGKNKRIITGGCQDAKIIVNSDRIFLLNKEVMDVNGAVVASSLYSMDLQGHNLRKVYYDLIDMEEVDEQRIFFLQQEKKKYKISTPQKKGDPTVTYIDALVKTYYAYDKFTRKIRKIFVLGEPKEQELQFKGGCFGRKKITKRSTIEEVQENNGYVRTGKMTLGQVYEEEQKKLAEGKANESNVNLFNSSKKGCSKK